MRRFFPATKTDQEHGAATLLVAAVIGIACLVCIVLVRLGEQVTLNARAHIAAEAAALAGALNGEAAAHHVASANGASIIEYLIDAPLVQVVVEIKGMRVSARAELIGFSTLNLWQSPISSNP